MIFLFLKQFERNTETKLFHEAIFQKPHHFSTTIADNASEET